MLLFLQLDVFMKLLRYTTVHIKYFKYLKHL